MIKLYGAVKYKGVLTWHFDTQPKIIVYQDYNIIIRGKVRKNISKYFLNLDRYKRKVL